MEMIDVLKTLKEIEKTKPELVQDAVDSVQKINPKEKENITTKEDSPADSPFTKTNPTEVAPPGREKQVKALKGKVDNPYAVAWASYNKSKGKKEAIGENFAKEGGMSDIHIGAQEAVSEYVNQDGNLDRPKADVLQDMANRKAKLPFPQSYEIETAMKMVQDDFDDNGQAKAEYEPDPDEIMKDAVATEEAGELYINGMTTEEDVISMIQDTIDAGKGEDAKDYLEQFKQYLFVKSGGRAESKELNTETMKKEDKKPIKEAITMTADSPEEAGMLMQIMKLAGVQQVTPDMVGAEAPAENDADHDHDGDGVQDHAPQDCPSDDAVGSGEMGKMRDMISQNDTDEQADEQFANEPEEKVHDVEKALQSGGLGASRKQVRKEYPGDNPLAAEDKVTEQDLANSLRTQYEGFKTSYQKAANEAKAKPDFLDMDKDGNKKEPMKKAIADKK